MSNFALVGAAGFVAPRHMKAIAETGNTLVAAVDPHDSVGIIDRYFPDAAFFTEVERFDRFLEKRRRVDPVHYLSICSPNYLHDAHVRLALRVGAHAICEKPLVLSPWNLDQLAALEQEYGRRVYSVMQLRLLPALQELKASQARDRAGGGEERERGGDDFITGGDAEREECSEERVGSGSHGDRVSVRGLHLTLEGSDVIAVDVPAARQDSMDSGIKLGRERRVLRGEISERDLHRVHDASL